MGYGGNDASHLVQAAARQGVGTHQPASIPGPMRRKRAGKRNMVIGGIVCVLGLVITLGTMAAASNSGGGVVVAWSWPSCLAHIQFFRGAAQAGGGSSEAG